MVLKAVPIYTSDQSDDLRLAPKARLVGRSASGPLPPFAHPRLCCAAARHCGLSPQLHYLGYAEGRLTVEANFPFQLRNG